MPDFQAVTDVCRSRFSTQVAAVHPVADVLYDNSPTDTPTDDTSLWVRFYVDFVTHNIVSICGGSNRYRIEGNCRARCSARIGTGTSSIYELVDLIVDSFKGVRDTEVLFFAPRVEPVGREDKWWIIDVVCPFTADRVA